MALAIDLMGVGLPEQQASLLGQSPLTTVVAAGTTTGTAAALAVSQSVITAAAGATGIRLPTSPTLTRLFFIRNSPASTASAQVYPGTGGRFNGGATDGAIAVIAGQSILVMYQGGVEWVAYQTNDSSDGIPAISGQTVSPRTIAIGGLVPAVSTDFTDTAPVITEAYIGEILLPVNMTVTGIALFNGSNVTGNVKVGLYDSTGALLAQSATTAGVGTDAYQLVPFTTPYSALGPSTYYIVSSYSSATARYNAPPLGAFGASKATGLTFGTLPLTVTPPTTFTTNLCNIASLY